MNRFAGRVTRWLAYVLAACCLVLILLAGAVWLGLPKLQDYKPQVERWMSGYLDQEITIAGLDADWDGFNITLRARGVRVALSDGSGSGMRFREIYLLLDPLTLLEEGRTFERLEVRGLTVEASRLPDGRIRVGDTIVGTPRGTLRRLLQSRTLEVTDTTLIWRDALVPDRGLRVEDVHIRVRSSEDRRHFDFTTSAPEELLQTVAGSGSYDPRSLGSGGWTASLSISAGGLNLARIPAIIQEQLPWESSGHVDTDVYVEWTRGTLTTASADLAARDFVIPYARDKTPLSAERFSSSVHWQRSDEEQRLVFTDPEIVLDGDTVSVSRFEVQRRDEVRTYTARDVDVRDLLGVVNELDIELPWKELIDSLRPRGDFSTAILTLTGPYLEADDWSFEGVFRNVGWRAQEHYPGIQGLDGHLTADAERGELTLSSTSLEVDAPDSLRRPVGFDRVAGSVEWYRWGEEWVVDISDAAAENDDLDLRDINLYTRVAGAEGAVSPFVLARFRIERADIRTLRDYLPANRMEDKKVEWLDRALAGGEITRGRFYLNGRLDEFPYRDGSGELRVSARVRDGLLDYHEKWPNLEGLGGVIEVNNSRFEARVRQGIMMNSPVEHARVWSEDFFRDDRRLHIQGNLAAKADDVIQFLRRGPLNRNPPPPYSTMTARGEGDLALKIELPFTRLKEASSVQGGYEFSDAAVEVADGIEFTELEGLVRFTEGTVEGQGLTGQLFGGPVEADVATVEPGRPMRFAITGTGESDISRLTPVVGPVLVSRLAGRAQWSGRFVGGPGPNQLDIHSDLNGVGILFPDPLYKTGGSSSAIDVDVQFERDQRRIRLDLADRLSGELHYERKNGRSVLSRGVLNIGSDQQLPEKELSIGVRGGRLDMDQWVAEIRELNQLRQQEDRADSDRDVLFEHLRLVKVDVDQFRYLRRDLGPIEVHATSGDSRDWTADFSGPRLEGGGRMRFDLEPARYDFQLSRLHWPRLENAERAATDETPQDPSGFIHLSISAEAFRYGEMRLGRLDLEAGPEGDAWRIRRLSLQQPALTVEADGGWSSDRFGAHRTRVTVTGKAGDLGDALGNLGLEDQVAGGSAEMHAELSWSGEPGDFSLAGLDGELSFDAEDGRFLKLEPGSGRLLGLFNIETITRRLKLDFTDVFKEGLAFDRINGKAEITQGRLATDGIFIAGPAALIELGGSTDLGDEQYDLEVTVAPQLGANLSLAGAIINPAAGAMLFVVQRLFRKQMAQLIHYKYRVTGDWGDPHVERVEQPAPEPSPQTER